MSALDVMRVSPYNMAVVTTEGDLLALAYRDVKGRRSIVYRPHMGWKYNARVVVNQLSKPGVIVTVTEPDLLDQICSEYEFESDGHRWPTPIDDEWVLDAYELLEELLCR